MFREIIRGCKNQVHRQTSWKIWFPVVVVLATVGFGALSGWGGSSKKAAWISVGHLIGETSFEQIPEYVTHHAFYIASRALGLLLLPYAFVLLVHEQYRDLFTQFRIWGWRVRHRRYVVVCGLGWKGFELVQHILKDSPGGVSRVVGIDMLASGDQIDELRNQGMAFFQGDATSDILLRNAKVIHADKVYILTGNDELNCRMAMKLAELFPEGEAGKKKLDCYVSVADRRQRDFLEDFATQKMNHLYIHCFNLMEQAARDILRSKGLVSSAEQHVHCVVVGNTPVAEAILLQCIRMLHLSEQQQRKITVLCRGHQAYRDHIFAQYPCLDPVETSLEMETAKIGVFPEIHFEELPGSNSGWMEYDCAVYRCMEAGWRTNVYMCVDNGMKSLSLLELICSQMNRFDGEMNAACYYNYPERGLDRRDTAWTEFGDYRFACSIPYLKHAAESELAKDILAVWGDRTTWLEQMSWSKESNRQAADHIYVKLALAGLTVDSPSEEIMAELGDVELEADYKPKVKTPGHLLDEMARIEHRRWCAERLLAGWLPLSATQDDRDEWNQGILEESLESQHYVKILKTQAFRHGDLIPFEMLLECERCKDYAIIGQIHAMAVHLNECPLEES